MLDKDIREFYRLVADDYGFINKILNAKQKCRNTQSWEEILEIIARNVVVPVAKEKGFYFSVKDIIDYERRSLGANIENLSLDDVEKISGGVGRRTAGICLSVLTGLAGLAGAGSLASHAVGERISTGGTTVFTDPRGGVRHFAGGTQILDENGIAVNLREVVQRGTPQNTHEVGNGVVQQDGAAADAPMDEIGTDDEDAAPVVLGANEQQAANAQQVTIGTADELRQFANDFNAGGLYAQNVNVTLSSDIDLGGGEILSIGKARKAFTGNFNGGSNNYCHTISGLHSINGLFKRAVGATIQNLTIRDGQIDGEKSAGAFVGHATRTKFINCHAIGTRYKAGRYVGAIVGKQTGGSRRQCSQENCKVRFPGSITIKRNAQIELAFAGKDFRK